MATGLGFKTFTTGEVLTAADTNGYLMQGVLVFASTAARDAAITSPQEGQFAYLKDTNVTTYYTGSAWTNLDTTGMTNPMTTTGDMVYSSSGSTPARLGIGTTGQVVTVAGGVPTWATPAGGGGKVLQVVQGTTTTTTSVTSATFTDTTLTATITPTLNTSKILAITFQPYLTFISAASMQAELQILRASTSIALSPIAILAATSGGEVNLGGNVNMSVLDSPATTSATTYKVQSRAVSGGTIRTSPSSALASIILLEIGA